jgi:N-acetylglutamate synthase
MTPKSLDIHPMTADDYDEVAALWQNTEGIGLDEHIDTREGIAGYLARHPGLSFVARQESFEVLECGDSSPLSAERSDLPRDAAVKNESGDESPHSKHRIIGAVLCGHDGRRGYLHHLAVAAACRRKGIGRALVEACLTGLGSVGIPKCNIFLLADNELGKTFWTHNGWNDRCDLKVLQKETPS